MDYFMKSAAQIMGSIALIMIMTAGATVIVMGLFNLAMDQTLQFYRKTRNLIAVYRADKNRD